MNTSHDLFHVMNIYLIMYCVYIIINVIPMYHQGEDPTLEPLGNNPYNIGRYGCIHANNLEKATNLDQSFYCIHIIQKTLGQYDEIHEECTHVLETNPHDDDSFFKVKKPLMRG